MQSSAYGRNKSHRVPDTDRANVIHHTTRYKALTILVQGNPTIRHKKRVQLCVVGGTFLLPINAPAAVPALLAKSDPRQRPKSRRVHASEKVETETGNSGHCSDA